MAYPNFKDKHLKKSTLEPKQFVNYYKKIDLRLALLKVPEAVILCYDRNLMNYICKLKGVKKTKAFGATVCYLPGRRKKIAAVGRFGIGAPVASAVFEEFIALGVKKFMSIGAAGGLQSNLKAGDIIVCERAIRDEGTSYHYIKPSKYAFPDKEFTEKVKTLLKEKKKKFNCGTSWTIDAPNRETIDETLQYKKDGVLTVEMEASALFAVAKYRKVELASVFAISDIIAELEWAPKWHTKKLKDSLRFILHLAEELLLKEI